MGCTLAGRMSASTDTTTGTEDSVQVIRPGDNGARDAEPVIVVKNVSKSFQIPSHRRTTLKERVLHPFARIPKRELQAAHDVSFEVHRGEFFGIVGRNGSGKSTLLKLLTGIYRQDSGEVRVIGRVSPLIELGVGFNPEMAARDNVLVNGTLLGLSRSEVLRRFDEIIEFAGLDGFSELALKNYSSGMLMRLAFSIAIHVDGDVLLLDEVLAVGDSGFQDKCNDTFRRLKKEGKTIVLVTHSMEAVRRFCDRALLMERGRVVEIGDPDEIAELYQDVMAADPNAGPQSDPSGLRHGDGSADIRSVWVEDEGGAQTRTLKKGGWPRIRAEIVFRRELEGPLFGFLIRSEDGRVVFTASTKPEETEGRRFAAGERVSITLRFENHLGVGTYEITPVVAHRDKNQWADARNDLYAFSVRGRGWPGAAVDLPHEFAIRTDSSR